MLVPVSVLVALLVLVAVLVTVRVVVGSKGTNASGWMVTAPMRTGFAATSPAAPTEASVDFTSTLRKVSE